MTEVVNIVTSDHSLREFDTAELVDTALLPVTKSTQDGRVYFGFHSVDATVNLFRTGQCLISGATDSETVQDARNSN